MLHGRRDRVHRPVGSVSFVAAVKRWDVSLQAANLSDHTRKSYMVSARQYYRWLVETGISHPTVAELNPSRVREFLAALRRQSIRGERRYQSSSLHTKVVGLKVFANWCAREHVLKGDAPLHAVRNPKQPRKISHPFTPAEAQALMAAAKASAMPERNVALLMLAFATGARAEELCTLTVDHLDLEGNIITVLGKGAKQRGIVFDQATSTAMAAWLAVRSSGAHEVFVSVKGVGMSPQTLYGVFRALGDDAGVIGARPHRARDTHAVFYAASHPSDLLGLQDRLGHENVNMTLRYARQARALIPLVGVAVVDQLGLLFKVPPKNWTGG